MAGSKSFFPAYTGRQVVKEKDFLRISFPSPCEGEVKEAI